MKRLLLVPIVLLGAAIALYLWAAVQPPIFNDWESAYD